MTVHQAFLIPRPLLLLATAALLLSMQTLVQALDLSIDEKYLQPDVTIEEHANRTVEEYSINGRRYKVKVTPKRGPSYYLIDQDGSGDMEMRRDTPGQNIDVPQWALKRW